MDLGSDSIDKKLDMPLSDQPGLSVAPSTPGAQSNATWAEPPAQQMPCHAFCDDIRAKMMDVAHNFGGPAQFLRHHLESIHEKMLSLIGYWTPSQEKLLATTMNTLFPL